MKRITDIPKEQFDSKDNAVEEIDDVTIKFAGDSGDGMQLTGNLFSSVSAIMGNDVATYPDFPAEIRAPAGTVGGVSGFQVHFSSSDIHTPGDKPDVFIAMNPAALKSGIKDVIKNGIIVVNTDAFTEANLTKAGYDKNPLEDGSLDGFRLIQIPITSQTLEALKDFDMSGKDKERSKNVYALGIVYWMFERTLDHALGWFGKKFAGKEKILEANIAVLKAGYHYAENVQLLPVHFRIKKAKLEKGTYRSITGNQAVALGILASSEISGVPAFLGSYPITPATEILAEVSKYKNFHVRTFQAEDEIAGIASSVGASVAGYLAYTTTSGPGLALKTEATGLAVITETPLVIVDVQRGGPSTGLPTKSEQADLLQAMYGRSGESPVCVIAAKSPVDCFYKTIEATRISTKYMVPVILLTDSFLSNSTEPFKIPTMDELGKMDIKFYSKPEGFQPYMRDKHLARPWVKFGTPGLEHRIGGLEKMDGTGNISYDPENHENMVKIRYQKILNIQEDAPDLEVEGSGTSQYLIVGWGSTYGAIRDTRVYLENKGIEIDHAHFTFINPFPKNTNKVLKKYEKVFIVEENGGQLAHIIRSKFGITGEKINKIKGQPFRVMEVIEAIEQRLNIY